MINTVMGTSGLFSMRANPTIHPLAQLSMLGKSMMYASIRNFTVGSALEFGGAIASKTFDEFIGSLGKAAGKMMSTVGLATMSMAFVLDYVLPFLPFIYFLFAITSWVKAIFEAIVAMPLWALAHIRIDGEGLGGPGATQGYFLLLEIFLRPILILFGLIASIQIFSALVFVMNDIFDLVVTNVSGFNHQGEMTGTVASALNTMRGPIDEFFFTALYVIMCYMLALGCFKLIDYIPNTILRWFGVSATPFTAQAGDSGGQILQQSYQLATWSTQKIEGGKLAALIGTR